MKRIIIILTTFTVLLTLTSCSGEKIKDVKKYYSTGTVFNGAIDLENSYIGYIEGKDTVNLSTKVGGRVNSILFEVGNFVKKGDLLLTLDATEAKTGFSTSENILNSLMDLKKSTSEMFDEQIIAMESKIKQVEFGKTGTNEGLENIIDITNSTLQTGYTSVETAKLNLEKTQIILNSKEKNIYKNAKSAIVGSIILDTNIINYIDELLGVTKENKNKNDSFEAYLGAKNTSILRETETFFINTNILYIEYKKYYDNKVDGKDPSNDSILKGLNYGIQLAEKLKTLMSMTYDVLDNSVENIYFTIDTINNNKKIISVFGTQIESSLLSVSGNYLLGLKGSKQGLDDFSNEKTLKIELLKKQLELANNILIQNKSISKGQITQSRIKKEIVSNQLKEINAGLKGLKKQKETKLNEIQAKINKVIGNKKTSIIMINNGKIFSPIDGLIISQTTEVGQVVGQGMSLLTVSNNSELELNIDIIESQSEDIKIGDKVLLDIEGNTKQINGIITNILSSKNLVTKKIGVEISLKNDGNKIKIGSFTRVIFKNNSEKTGIIISNGAIISKFMIPGVYVIKKGVVRFKNIEILKQNDSFSEVKGLKVGEIIIIKGKENILDGEVLKL